MSLAIGTSTGPIDLSQALDSTTWTPQQVTHEPSVVSSGTHDFSTCDTTTATPTTMGLTALQPQGMVSTSPLATSEHSGETKERATESSSVLGSPAEIQNWPNVSALWSLDTSIQTAGSLPGTTTGTHVLHWGMGTSSQISSYQV